MDYSKVEKFSKKMEIWHNRLYRWVCIGMYVLVSDIIGVGIIGWGNYRSSGIESFDAEWIMGMYDVIIYVGSRMIFIFLTYTLLFTGFQFPIRFKGDGHGHKIKPTSYN